MSSPSLALAADWSEAAGFTRRAFPGFTLLEDGVAVGSEGFAHAVAYGLSDHPRWLHARYLYDERGSELFERITEQPEYYLTRAETAILERRAGEIRELVGPLALVELGSGLSRKTRHLLSAWQAEGVEGVRYVPIDIDRSALITGCRKLVELFPGLEVTALATSYDRGLPLVGGRFPLLLVFLGSSVGNFNSVELDQFLDRVASSLRPGDGFLLGIDLIKDPAVLEAAYNDAAGFSARFTQNLFRRMNRELGTTLPFEEVQHVAYYNERLERIEIYARFPREVEVELRSVGRRFRIAAGEMILTEISSKYRIEKMRVAVARFGFDLTRVYTDDEERFGLLLFQKRRDSTSTEDHRARLAARLTHVRRRTLDLISPLADEQLGRQYNSVMSPLAWDLGHIARFERHWLVERAAESPVAQSDFGTGGDFEMETERQSAEDDGLGIGGDADGAGRRSEAEGERGEGLGIYDAVTQPRPGRGALALPERDDLLKELARVRASALDALAAAPLDQSDPLRAGGFVYNLVAQHEAQHQETMLQAIALIPGIRYEPVFREAAAPADYALDEEMIVVPAGPFPLGSDRADIAYDNERPLHWVELTRFAIDVVPVSNGAFLEFMRDGGYRRRELWSEAGWSWRAAEGIAHPATWRGDGSGGWLENRFGRLRPVALNRPVAHVSWHEASAYARWAGKRLPSEAEWEKAASWDVAAHAKRLYPWGDEPPGLEQANLDQRLFGSAEIGAYPRGRSLYGCHQMLGDVWEWTASDFLPYPGFRSFPYREYSEIFFGAEYKVLRGGSWATSALVARNTFRNWDLPIRRQIFAGFRCARDC